MRMLAGATGGDAITAGELVYLITVLLDGVTGGDAIVPDILAGGFVLNTLLMAGLTGGDAEVFGTMFPVGEAARKVHVATPRQVHSAVARGTVHQAVPRKADQ